jgi:hypothetical protein
MSCKNSSSNYFSNIHNNYSTIEGYKKIFDCEKWANVKTIDGCDIDIYIKIGASSIDFLVKTTDKIEYKIFLYDFMGNKLIEKDLNKEIEFKKEGLTNGLYLIKITDGLNVYTKKIDI